MRSRPLTLLALVPLAVVVLVAGACGDTGSITRSGSSSGGSGSGTGTGSGRSDFDPKVCDAIEGSDLPDDLASMLPDGYGKAIGVVTQFASAMDSSDDQTAPGAVKKLADALSVDGVGDDLVDLSVALEDECGKSDGTDAFRYLGEASALVSVEANDEYCAALEQVFAADSGADPGQLATVRDRAPEEHRAAIDALADLSTSGQPSGDGGVEALGSAFFGIGLYAEGRCGIEGGFAQMLIGAAFVGMGDDSSASEGSGDTDGAGGETGVEPAAADPSAASAAAPAGSGLAFEAVRVDLEDDGEYLASIVAPSGWEQSRMINVTFDPPSGSSFSIFSSFEVSAGCDGICAPTDWEARLRGSDGYLTTSLDGWTVSEETATPGSEGVGAIATKDDGSTRVVVLRWDDDADRYFQCVADLDADDAALAPAMRAACEASRPGWIPVS